MSIVQRILSKNKIKSEIEVVIGDEKLIFRYFKSSGELQEATQKASEFVNTVLNRPTEAFKAIGITNKEDAQTAFLIHYLSVEPKITQLEALQITQNIDVCAEIFNAIENRKIQAENEKAEEVIEEKKDSNKIPTTD